MIKRSIGLACATLLGCSRAGPDVLSSADAQQLLEVALANDLTYAKTGERTVCVQSDLEPPLHDIRDSWKLGGTPPASRPIGDWRVDMKQVPKSLAAEIDAALRDAVLGRGSDAPVEKIDPVPRPLVGFPKGREPKECDTNALQAHGPFVNYISRPVIARGYAFIEHGGVCGALCGSGFLHAYRKRDRRWVLVATTPTWIS